MDSTAVILPIYVLLCSYIQYIIDLKETLRSWVNLNTSFKKPDLICVNNQALDNIKRFHQMFSLSLPCRKYFLTQIHLCDYSKYLSMYPFSNISL